jgi:5-methylcytosine-specific restriction endonuclease McrA
VDEFNRTHPRPPGGNHCEVDHIVPLSKGGPDTPANMQWLPRNVHREKTKQDLYGN